MIVSENKICSFPLLSHEVKNTSVGGGRGVKVRGGVGKACFVKKQPWPSSANSLGMWPKRRLGEQKALFKEKVKGTPKVWTSNTNTAVSSHDWTWVSGRWRSMSLVPEEDQEGVGETSTLPVKKGASWPGKSYGLPDRQEPTLSSGQWHRERQ